MKTKKDQNFLALFCWQNSQHVGIKSLAKIFLLRGFVLFPDLIMTKTACGFRHEIVDMRSREDAIASSRLEKTSRVYLRQKSRETNVILR